MATATKGPWVAAAGITQLKYCGNRSKAIWLDRYILPDQALHVSTDTALNIGQVIRAVGFFEALIRRICNTYKQKSAHISEEPLL